MSQHYTACGNCNWFGIPIIDGMAPEECNQCLLRNISNAKTLLYAVNEIEALQSFFDRQDVLEASERRFNGEPALREES
jgi:hypothetical protein